MKLNISQFKKVRTEPDHTVLKHPAGHEIKVLHKPLSKDVKKQLDELPHHSEGSSSDHLEVSSQDRTKQFNKAASRVDSNVKAELQHHSDGGNVKLQQAHAPHDLEALKKENCANRVQHYDSGTDYVEKPDSPANLAGGDSNKRKEVENSVRSGGTVVGPIDAAKKLFGFADGGEVGHSNLTEALKNLSSVYAQPQVNVADPSQNQFNVTAPENLQQPPQEMPQQEQPQAQVPIDPNAPPQGTLPEQAVANVESANRAELSGAQNIAGTEAAKADIYGQQAQHFQDLRSKYEEIGNDLHKKYNDLSQEVQQARIDPHQWWNNKSTGSQILTAIGMLFGGAGAGVAGHPEMASEAINKAVDRDIDSQKANLQNKNTLLSKYLEMYNSLPQAEAAARLTLNAGVEGLINQQAAKLGSANAMNAAQMAVAQRRQALLPQMEGLARGQVMGQMYNGMSKSSAPASSAEEAYQKRMQDMRILNPDLGKDMENKYLPNVGIARVPVPDKLREDLTVRKDLSDKLAQLELFAKEHGGTIMDRAVVNQGKAMAAQVQDAYRTAHQQGVFKESEKNFVNSILNADPTSFLSNVRSLPGYRQARQFNDQTVKKFYESYGIKPFSGSNEQESGGQSPIAINRQTGERLIQQNGKWVPYNGQ